jgi:hypothetical protein
VIIIGIFMIAAGYLGYWLGRSHECDIQHNLQMERIIRGLQQPTWKVKGGAK